MYEDCRSKKLKAGLKKEGLRECECERARQPDCVRHNGGDSSAVLSSSCAPAISPHTTTIPSNGAPILATSLTTPTVSSSTLPGATPSSSSSSSHSSQTILKNEGAESSVDPLAVLSRAPHLIMQYHNEGSVSYILTLPAANPRGGVVKGGGGGGPRLLPRAPTSNGLVSTSLRQLQPSPMPSLSPPTLTSFPLLKKNSKIKKAQVKEKDTTNVQREGVLDRLRKAISGLAQPAAMAEQGRGFGRESQSSNATNIPVDSINTSRQYADHVREVMADGGGDEGNFSMEESLDPDLLEIPLSWLSTPGSVVNSAEGSMEGVLSHPSEVAATALLSKQQQQQRPVDAGLDDEGVALPGGSGREEMAGNGSCFMDAYNLEFDSSTLDKMLGAQVLMDGGGGASGNQCAPGAKVLSSLEPLVSEQGTSESFTSSSCMLTMPGAASPNLSPGASAI